MPLRILHISDLHLGAKFLWLGDKGPEQRKALQNAFERAASLARQEDVDIFLIAGDLFDSNSVSKSILTKASEVLKELLDAGVRVFISPGTHDPAGAGSVYERPPLSNLSGLHVFKTEYMQEVRLPELDCSIYGHANRRPFENKYPLSGFCAKDESRWKIGVIHAGFDVAYENEEYVVRSEDVVSCGLDYLALGHYHSHSNRTCGKTVVYYAGSPEILKMQKGERGCALLVELEDGVKVRALDVSEKEYEEVTLDAEMIKSPSDVLNLVLPLSNPSKILKISIEGMKTLEFPDFEAILEELSEKFYFVSVNDGSCDEISIERIKDYPEDSAIGAYLKVLEERLARASEDERSEILEAMRLGVSLLQEEG